jgi:hypothetical protein
VSGPGLPSTRCDTTMLPTSCMTLADRMRSLVRGDRPRASASRPLSSLISTIWAAPGSAFWIARARRATDSRRAPRSACSRLARPR